MSLSKDSVFPEASLASSAAAVHSDRTVSWFSTKCCFLPDRMKPLRERVKLGETVHPPIDSGLTLRVSCDYIALQGLDVADLLSQEDPLPGNSTTPR